jgi:hypothetical protein
VYRNLVNAYGWNPNIYDSWDTGRQQARLRLVSDGMKLQPCSPGFVDGRNDGHDRLDRPRRRDSHREAVRLEQRPHEATVSIPITLDVI